MSDHSIAPFSPPGLASQRETLWALAPDRAASTQGKASRQRSGNSSDGAWSRRAPPRPGTTWPSPCAGPPASAGPSVDAPAAAFPATPARTASSSSIASARSTSSGDPRFPATAARTGRVPRCGETGLGDLVSVRDAGGPCLGLSESTTGPEGRRGHRHASGAALRCDQLDPEPGDADEELANDREQVDEVGLLFDDPPKPSSIRNRSSDRSAITNSKCLTAFRRSGCSGSPPSAPRSQPSLLCRSQFADTRVPATALGCCSSSPPLIVRLSDAGSASPSLTRSDATVTRSS